MLNIKNLSNLLTKNVHANLSSSIYIFSLTGSLVAYSTPANTRALRNQAALIQLSWHEYAESHTALKALTMESEGQNVIVRSLKKNYVLVLVGPSSFQGEQVTTTAEVEGAARYPPLLEDEDALIESLAERDEDDESQSAVTVLHLQRRKVDGLAEFLEKAIGDAGAVEDMDYGKLFQ